MGVLRTHPDAPRVLLANSNLVGRWSTWEVFRELEAKGLMMYGQMTAGSWIYIGTQGILQGTYETFAQAGRTHFGTDDLSGRLVLSGGLGGMGGAQPLAATMNGAAFLGVEVDPERARRRVEQRYLDAIARDLDDALAQVEAARSRRQARSVAVIGNAADVYPELVRRGVRPDLVTDQTSAHDPLNGYVPQGLSLAEAAELRRTRPEEHVRRAQASMGVQVAAMLEMKARGSHVFDYGNNLRAGAQAAGLKNAFDFPGFVPAYIRPLFCEGQGPFRWVALSGDPEDIRRTDRAVLELFPEKTALAPVDRPGLGAGGVPGPPGAHLLARLRRAPSGRAGVQRAGAQRRGEGAHRHRTRPPRLRLGGVPQPRDRGDEGRLGRGGRLAAPQRPGERGERGELGERAQRRRAWASATRSTPGR